MIKILWQKYDVAGRKVDELQNSRSIYLYDLINNNDNIMTCSGVYNILIYNVTHVTI